MRLLLLTDIPPCKNHTAGIVINKWCDFLLEDGHSVFCFSVKDPHVYTDIPDDKKNSIVFENINKPKERWKIGGEGRFFKVLSRCYSFLCNNSISLFVLPKKAKRAAIFAKRNKCEYILVSVQGQTMIRLARMVSKWSGLSYTAQTWDPPEWWLKDHLFDKVTTKLVMREFSRMLKDAKFFMAMSWAMSVEYEKLYGARCVTNLPGLSESDIKKPERRDDSFIIAFSGQLYARTEIDALIRAITLLNWRYQDRQIVLRIYGSYFSVSSNNKVNIEYKGYLDQELLISEMKDADLLYCPYWFSEKYEKPCRLSFPGKLTSYLKTGRPVFMHSPTYASPTILLQKFNAAYICDTLEDEKIANYLCSIIDDSNSSDIGKRGSDLFKLVFSYSKMKKSLMVSLGLCGLNEIGEYETYRSLYDTEKTN